MNRQLVNVVTVSAISEIPKSDFLVLLSFKECGWQCVTTKDSVRVGDTGLYFEVDSFLPVDNPAFEFMKKNGIKTLYTGEVGMRVRTVKLRGQVSQGLFLGWDKFLNIDKDEAISGDLGDLSLLLNVIKYEVEPEISLTGDKIGEYPGHTPRSYQARIQNEPEFFTRYIDVEFERTLKLEGTSTSFIYNNGEVFPASHNTVYRKNDKFSPWKYIVEQGIDKAMVELGLNVSIQGEFMGPKINKNIENFKEFKFFTYNIFKIDESQWMSRSERKEYIWKINQLLSDGCELLHVPTLEASVKIFSAVKDLDELLKLADGPSINAKRREGDVYKSLKPIDGQYVQFKVISNAYLLKEK